MAADVDGLDVFQAKVPLQIWVQEGSNEPTTGSVHMNAHLPALLLVHLLCSNKQKETEIREFAGTSVKHTRTGRLSPGAQTQSDKTRRWPYTINLPRPNKVQSMRSLAQFQTVQTATTCLGVPETVPCFRFNEACWDAHHFKNPGIHQA